MKKKILFLATLFMILTMITVVQAAQVKTTEVSPASSNLWTVNLDDGDKFSGSLSISGGSGNDINFKVTNPQGTAIIDFGRVSQGRSFDFTATQSGAYTFHLDNTFSIFSSKAVTLSYDITPAVLSGLGGSSGISWTNIGIIIAVVLAVLAVVLLAVSITKRAKK